MKKLIPVLLLTALSACSGHSKTSEDITSELKANLIGYFNVHNTDSSYVLDSIQAIKVDTMTEKMDSLRMCDYIYKKIGVLNEVIQLKLEQNKAMIANIRLYKMIGSNELAKINAGELKDSIRSMNQIVYKDSVLLQRVTSIKDSLSSFDSIAITGYALEVNIFAHSKDNISRNTKNMTFYFNKQKYLNPVTPISIFQ